MSTGDRRRVTSQAIDQIVQVVVDRVAPRRIVLFGSAARGDKNEPSDVDLMVVVDDEADRREVAGVLYRAMYDAEIGVGVDFVVATEAVLERYGDTAGLVYRAIARDGRELYVAA